VKTWHDTDEGETFEDPPRSKRNGYTYEGEDTWHEKKPRRIRLTRFDEITLDTEEHYLIRGLIPRVGLTVIWGPPKCGKSFVAFDAIMHIAIGREYRGRYVEQGAVVYCAFEGAHGFKARKEAWRQQHLAEQADDDVPFYLMPLTLNLVQDCGELIEAIKEDVDGAKPAVVVLDTLNRSLQGSEDKGEDMGAYVRAADAIREAFNCAVVIVHHCGHEGTRPRGHSSLIAAADAILSVRKENGQVVLKVDTMKDGPEGDELASRLRFVTVGETNRGHPITSCVVDPVAEVPLPREEQLTANQRTMLRILYDAGAAGLALEEWNKRAREAGLALKRPATLTDLRMDLKSKKLVHEFNGVWKATRK
jgi:hypothetical protein